MAASDAGAWARLRLVQGDSATSHWEFGGGTATETRLTVGSNPSCQWVVDDPSVEPFHLVFRWDGTVLAVAGSRESVALSLDGQPVGTTFVKVGARARLEFGRCALVAETSTASAQRRKSTISSAPPPPAHSSRPPKQTVTGVAPLTDSTPPTRVPDSTPAPGRSATQGSDPGATAIGLPPAPDEAPRGDSDRPGRFPSPGGPAAPGKGSDRPGGSTLYGIGGAREGLSVDVVSPSRLRRSSVPPRQQPEDDPGRATEPGYHDPRGQAPRGGSGRPLGTGQAAAARDPRADPTPTDTRLVEDAQKLRAMASTPPPGSQQPGAGPAASWRGAHPPVEPPADSDRPAAAEADPAPESGSDSPREPGEGLGQAQGPGHFRPSGPLPARRPSTLAILVGLGAVAAFGVWVYALIKL